MSPIVVIGLGNLLLSDEGIGVALARDLAREASAWPGVEVLEMGTGGLAVVHALEGRRAALFLDCARMGTPPGTLRRFAPAAVAATPGSAPLTLHAGNLLDLLALARRTGSCPPDVVIVGIEPASLAPGRALSARLRARLPAYRRAVRAELRRLTARLRNGPNAV